MKGKYPIRIDHSREPNLPGGRWTDLDPVGKGQVQIVTVRDLHHQAAYVKSEMDRIRQLVPNTEWSDFAVLSRTRTPLGVVRSVLEKAGCPVRIPLDKSLPIQRVREVQSVLARLETKEKENIRAADLREEIKAVRGERDANIWWWLIEAFFDEYEEETSNTLRPVSWAIDSLCELLAEQRREKIVGHGIFMSTIHSVKGMEFPHVFILDGDWSLPLTKSQQEEERRIMYVGMSRAEETLRLLKIPNRPNPFLKEINGNSVMGLTYRGSSEKGDTGYRRYESLGLNEIYLDYAGCFAPTEPIHEWLSILETGQSVSLCQRDSRIEIHDPRGRCVGRLSTEAAKKWGDRLDHNAEVKVLAMIQRNRDDPSEEFMERIRATNWEVPVLEAAYSWPAGRP